ncbi:MAG: TolB family protein [Acidobacteriota bacterium]
MASEDPPLRIEPGAIALEVDLAQPAPAAVLHVYAGDRDVTADAAFALAGAPLGTVEAGTLTSNGFAGGAATLVVTYGGARASVPVTAHVRGVRFDGVPASAADAFATGPRVERDAQLEPGNGAILPPNLGRLDVDFTADDTDSLHAVAVRSPYLDLTVYSAGAPGPRRVALSSREWSAVASTARGRAGDLEVAATSASPGAPIHVAAAHVAIADLDASSLAFTAARAGETPHLWRYDVARSSQQALVTLETCVGCHVAVSPDGTRLATASNGAGVSGYLFDLGDRSIVARTDDVGVWTAASFTAGGELVTGYLGSLALRDAATGELIAPIPTRTPAAEPAVSPDGHTLAYISLETVGEAFLGGDALAVMARDPATGAFGAPRELARGAAVLEPEVSSDSRWIAYTRNATQERFVYDDTDVVSIDGETTIRVTTGALDGLARWASPIVDGRAWLAVVSTRPLAGVAQPPQLWLVAIDLATGTVSRPVHLPGQDLAWLVMHAPMRLPLSEAK